MNRHRNLSFYIESLLLLLFLLAVLAVLIRVFGAAQTMGLQARQKTDAALVLQTVSAEFSAQAEPAKEKIREARQEGNARLEYLRDEQGNAREEGPYRVVMELHAEAEAAGDLVTARICVTPASAAEENPVGELETTLYCPGQVEEAAHS